MRYLIFLPLILTLYSCNERPAVTNASGEAAERAHPGTFLKVNYQVRRNLVGKKIIEGEVLNTGRFQTYNSVSLSIEMTQDGHKTIAEYTVAGTLPPGGRNAFKYKPERVPDHVDIHVSAATAK
jgi:hypothetical protein